MKLTLPRIAINEARRLGREDEGVALVFVLGSFLFLFIACLGVVSLGNQIREKAELQNACDAAAYSASVVQADGLSRMAVVNRAMAWSYIQMTKMQMDYITLRWLELTKERFEDDERCIYKTKLIRMFSKDAAYHHFESDWNKLGFIKHFFEDWGFPIPPWIVNLRFGFTCRDGTHYDPRKNSAIKGRPRPNAAYIGFKGIGEDDPKDVGKYSRIGHVRLNYPSKDTSGRPIGLYLPVRDGDRRESDKIDTLNDKSSPMPTLSEVVKSMQAAYGVGGSRLTAQIAAMRQAIVTCNVLLPAINAKMSESIRETAVRTLRENLPRREDGMLDEDLLKDYDWMVSGGVSSAPVQYSAGMGNRGNNTSYFSGLRNVEEDEILFLNMADGLPKATGGNVILKRRNPKDVRLVDYFADEEEVQQGKNGETTKFNRSAGVAAGLDQWFIRCNPSEPGISDQKSIKRSFAGAEGGIVRGYKNANYYEGQSGSSLLAHAINFGEGVHRPNYIIDGIQDLTYAGEQFVEGQEKELMNKAEEKFKGFFDQMIKQLAMSPSDQINPGKKPKWYKVVKRMKWQAKKSGKKALEDFVDPLWDNMADSLRTHIFNPLNSVLVHFFEGLIDFDPDPSCINTRARFIDTCANVRETTGLVSEYEWASAYWFCFWYKIILWSGRYEGEFHVPAPMAALHGGVKTKRDGKAVRTDSYDHGFFCPWFKEELREFTGKPKGKSRNDYHSSFISVDCDYPLNCNHWPGVFGKRSNFILKGYVRIYGDDKAIYDDNYVGVPAQPWILNERFFNGGGTITVGVSKRQRNYFGNIFTNALAIAAPSIYSAFSPPPASGGIMEDVPDDSQNRRFVAFAAARAGYAPRTGNGEVGAGGRDTVNTGGASAPRRYELRWDSVTDRNLGDDRNPTLPNVKGLNGWRNYFERVGRLGCVCGEPNTTERLKHQWNLCQVDWDGLLLPLREAHASHSAYDSAKAAYGGTGRDSQSNWEFFTDRDRKDSVNSTVGQIIYGNAVWRSFGETNGTTRSTSEIMPLPKADDESDPVDLFRLRRIL